jgi:uncharacterized protein (DUF1501 family)
VSLPPKLFSHNDQQSVWQAYRPIGEGAKIGWGGRIGDLLASQNANALFTCISAGGNSVFLSGANVLQYQVGSSGPAAISSISGTIYGSGGIAASTAYRSLITGTSPNLFENELRVVTNRSITANQQLSAALPSASTLLPAIPANNNLASQLSVVARIIAARTTLGSSRQVFLVSIGGFDNHDFLLTQHAQQLTLVNNAVGAFYSWLVQLGVQNDVTLFTASDFGRTLTSNGDGSDHGFASFRSRRLGRGPRSLRNLQPHGVRFQRRYRAGKPASGLRGRSVRGDVRALARSKRRRHAARPPQHRQLQPAVRELPGVG